MTTSNGIVLSVLTPAVPSRMLKLETLCVEISRQSGSLAVEHLVFLDNKKRTVGEKRDALLRMARGKYVAFVDDDDWIMPDYIESLVQATASNPDVITFRQLATVNGVSAEVEFRLNNPHDRFEPGTIVRRGAWHVCAWKRSLATLSRFPALNYGEDAAFAEPLQKLAATEEHIPRVLHFYNHDQSTTEAPDPLTLAH